MFEVLLPMGIAGLVYYIYERMAGAPHVPSGDVSVSVDRVTPLAPARLDAQNETAPKPQAEPKRWPDRLSFDQARALAEKIIAAHFPMVSPKMVLAMIEIESNFERKAERHEPHIRNRYTSAGDWSIGLMQLLYTTAKWLHEEMGKRAYTLDDPSPLYGPEVNIYFGCAYIAYLMNWKGVPRSEEWVVMSYNGGPGADNTMTRNHLAKYRAAKERQAGRWG